ncbi:MAG: efflux RND transporter periplasmic adaptor subunit [Thermogemmata sp.]|nr:efflux RND transporter periplasmic adaptor subunit [Thermogemmata sp.]
MDWIKRINCAPTSEWIMKINSKPTLLLEMWRLSMLMAGFIMLTPGCNFLRVGAEEKAEEQSGNRHQIVVTTPQVKDVVIRQPYVCQIRSRQYIEVRALVEGYIEQILIKEGQQVKKGDVMFKILPILYRTRLEAELAEVRLAQIKLDNARRLQLQKVVSEQEVAMLEAELTRAKAKAEQARAELEFTQVRAPFDGIVDRQQQQLGSLVKKDDVLTSLSDNSIMWVYFNVPERRYLEYMHDIQQNKPIGTLELMLADGSIYPYKGELAAIEAKFNNETGNIPFRADFPNPTGLLRHGQTGTILVHRKLKDALIIPQRATFEILEKQFVFVVDENNVVHQREITVQHEMDDIFVIKKGLLPQERIVLEGVRQVQDGERIEYTSKPIEDVLAHLKYHAE